jgi:hypothetical protein
MRPRTVAILLAAAFTAASPDSCPALPALPALRSVQDHRAHGGAPGAEHSAGAGCRQAMADEQQLAEALLPPTYPDNPDQATTLCEHNAALRPLVQSASGWSYAAYNSSRGKTIYGYQATSAGSALELQVGRSTRTARRCCVAHVVRTCCAGSGVINGKVNNTQSRELGTYDTGCSCCASDQSSCQLSQGADAIQPAMPCAPAGRQPPGWPGSLGTTQCSCS